MANIVSPFEKIGLPKVALPRLTTLLYIAYLWIAPFCDTLHCDPGEPHIARAKARKATTGKVDPSWLSTLGKSFDGRKTFIVPHPPMNGIPPTIPTATTAI